MPRETDPPILRAKHPDQPSQFTADGLLREARRQKGVPDAPIPRVCVLDPDGDVVRRLRAEGRAEPEPAWACYHSEMDRFTLAGEPCGIVGCAVGAPYAVLVAEQMAASGCELVLSVTSAGQLSAVQDPPYHVLIDRALRDEGTSYHYLPADAESAADPALVEMAGGALAEMAPPVLRGATWTTDAPFRETEPAIAAAQARGVMAVEMEAAGLYAFARATGTPVLCFAHVTNQMAQVEGDFEKGEAEGTSATLNLLARVVAAWARARQR
ncbi:Uridine phosphorylase [Limimonas halophila]|uniref:Uridine phosphorylase n=1 Tax=Limimonas halophila TaxID=1082479 RepID=A0A1G7QXL2_9PROT|nr:nucleoside phosphorylase [Limimonas halophila]SDG03247.1 Uridine phosphorylase [Limimonas halophila]